MKAKLLRGEPVVGLFSNIQVPTAVEIVAILGVDYIIVDAEHTAVTPETAENLYRAAEIRGITPITRIGENSQQVIQKYMEAGSMGVLMPLINTAEDAKRVVDSVKYPPMGKRGLAASRAEEWALSMPFADYVKMANEETLIAIQIETRDAIKNFDAIVRVEGVDVIFFGPTDLSSAFNLHGQIRHPEVVSTIERLGKATIAAGKIAATLAPTLEDYKRYREMGFLWFTSGVAQMLARGTREFLSEIREYEKGRG